MWLLKWKCFSAFVLIHFRDKNNYSLYSTRPTRMWANANVMAARPNIGGTLCSTPQSLANAHYAVTCSNAAKKWNPLKCGGVPQTRQQISAASGPKFTISWGHVGETMLFKKFFSDCRYVPQLQRYSPRKLCDGAQMLNFWRFFGSCISSQPRAAHFRPAF